MVKDILNRVTFRPYRDGMPTEKAMSILRECRGTQLDADFTEAFLASTLREVHPIHRIGERELPAPGPLTRAAADGVAERIRASL